MLQLTERCYWKFQINQYNGRRCNCRHKNNVPAGQFDGQMSIFLMTCLSLNMWSCLPEERTKQGHFLFLHTHCFLNFTFFQSRWLRDFCTLKKCIPSSCMCGASVYSFIDFFYFLIPPPLPKSLLAWWWAEALSAGCWSWGRTQPWIWACALAGLWCHSLCRVTRALLPFHPPPWSHSLKSYKQTAVSGIAAPIGHCSGCFKSPGDPSFYFFVWLQLWKIQGGWIPAGSLIQEKCQEIKLSATCRRVKVLVLPNIILGVRDYFRVFHLCLETC